MILSQLSNKLKFTGCYLCPHFQYHKEKNDEQSENCCGQKEEYNYIPYCYLSDCICNGLTSCYHLPIDIKSDYIQKWKIDLEKNKKIDAKYFTE